PGEDGDAGDEAPARRRRVPVRPARHRPCHREERQPVVHLIARAGLEDRQHVRVEPAAKPVRAERARRHGQAGEERAQGEERPVHGDGPYTDQRAGSTASSSLTVTSLRPRARRPSTIRGTASAVANRRWFACMTTIDPGRACDSTVRTRPSAVAPGLGSPDTTSYWIVPSPASEASRTMRASTSP